MITHFQSWNVCCHCRHLCRWQCMHTCSIIHGQKQMLHNKIAGAECTLHYRWQTKRSEGKKWSSS